MEQIENILALRARLSNGALVEIPRENPLIMMPAHDGDVLIVMLAETSGNLRTLNNMDRKYKVPPVYKVSPVHNAVVVVEGNYIHWCMVTVDEIAGFVKGNEGRVVQNDNLFLRRGADDEQALRLALPYRAADNNLTVAEVGCDLFIDPTSGALLSSDRRGAAGRLVSARLLFVTHLQRDSAMWTGEQVDAVSKRDTVRTDVSNEDSPCASSPHSRSRRRPPPKRGARSQGRSRCQSRPNTRWPRCRWTRMCSTGYLAWKLGPTKHTGFGRKTTKWLKCPP